jgi:hypothetical protein
MPAALSGDQDADPSPYVALFSEVAPLILAACAWLQQRIVVWSPGAIERHQRKAFARELHRETLTSEVKVIELRRRESQPHSAGDGTVDWSCRWVVDGHWTHQPYGPGRSERKLM